MSNIQYNGNNPLKVKFNYNYNSSHDYLYAISAIYTLKFTMLDATFTGKEKIKLAFDHDKNKDIKFYEKSVDSIERPIRLLGNSMDFNVSVKFFTRIDPREYLDLDMGRIKVFYRSSRQEYIKLELELD